VIGDVIGLAGVELVGELDMDGNINDAAIDGGSLGSVGVDVARNWPLGSHQVYFTSVADVRLTVRWNTRPRLK
jgi:hypothetical protein